MAEYRFSGHSPHVRNVIAFVAAARGEGPVVCTGQDGREAVRLILTAYASAAADAPVSPADVN